jgi:signal transduction histidine kinase
MRRERLWLVYLGLGLATMVVYFPLADNVTLGNLIYDGVAVSAAVAICVGARIHRPRKAGAWYLLALGQLMFAVGDLIWFLQDRVGTVPFPSVADAAYLAGYPLSAAAVIILLRARSPRRNSARLVEAAMLTMGGLLLGWEPMIEPSVEAAGLSPLQWLVSVAYPVGDFLILAVIVRMAVGARTAGFAYRALAAGVVALLVSDVAYAVEVWSGSYAPGDPADFGWLLSYILLGTAALHPSMRALSERATDQEPGLSRTRLILLAVSTLIAPALVVYEQASGDVGDIYLFAVASVLMFGLVVVRMAMLVREVEAKARELDSKHDQLERAMEARKLAERDRRRLLGRTLQAVEDERMRIAADLHDGPIQALSTLGYRLERTRRLVERGDYAGALESVEPVQHGLSREIQGLRQLMTSLRPPALDEQGLEGALRDQLNEFEARTGVRWDLDARLDGRLPAEVETVLYRVSQEALTNVSKHARAGRVWLELRRENGTVELAVRDNGVGFDTHEARSMEEEGHFGLVAVREQAKLVGGTCEVRSDPGRGTTIRVVLPAGGTQ